MILRGFVAVLMFALSGCATQTQPQSYETELQQQLAIVDKMDGVSAEEATVLGDWYLLQHAPSLHNGHHPATIQVVDCGNSWCGEVQTWTLFGVFPADEIPPVVIDKRSGTISWPYKDPLVER